MCSGCQVHLTITWLDISSLTGLGEFPLAYDWLNQSKVEASRISQRQKIVWNRGLWLVGSPESRLLIGRELPPKIFKGGTLTVQNLCLKYLLRVRYITSRVNRVRHITSRVKRVGYITSRVKLYQEFPYRSPFVKCVGISRVVWNIFYAWDTSPHAFIAWDTSSHGSRVHHVRHIISRVKLYQEFPYRSPFVKCVGVSRVVWNIFYAWDTSSHA